MAGQKTAAVLQAKKALLEQQKGKAAIANATAEAQIANSFAVLEQKSLSEDQTDAENAAAQKSAQTGVEAGKKAQQQAVQSSMPDASGGGVAQGMDLSINSAGATTSDDAAGVLASVFGGGAVQSQGGGGFGGGNGGMPSIGGGGQPGQPGGEASPGAQKQFRESMTTSSLTPKQAMQSKVAGMFGMDMPQQNVTRRFDEITPQELEVTATRQRIADAQLTGQFLQNTDKLMSMVLVNPGQEATFFEDYTKLKQEAEKTGDFLELAKFFQEKGTFPTQEIMKLQLDTEKIQNSNAKTSRQFALTAEAHRAKTRPIELGNLQSKADLLEHAHRDATVNSRILDEQERQIPLDRAKTQAELDLATNRLSLAQQKADREIGKDDRDRVLDGLRADGLQLDNDKKNTERIDSSVESLRRASNLDSLVFGPPPKGKMPTTTAELRQQREQLASTENVLETQPGAMTTYLRGSWQNDMWPVLDGEEGIMSDGTVQFKDAVPEHDVREAYMNAMGAGVGMNLSPDEVITAQNQAANKLEELTGASVDFESFPADAEGNRIQLNEAGQPETTPAKIVIRSKITMPGGPEVYTRNVERAFNAYGEEINNYRRAGLMDNESFVPWDVQMAMEVGAIPNPNAKAEAFEQKIQDPTKRANEARRLMAKEKDPFVKAQLKKEVERALEEAKAGGIEDVKNFFGGIRDAVTPDPAVNERKLQQILGQ